MTKKKRSIENTVKNIRRNSRRQYSGEEKIRIVLEGLRGEESRCRTVPQRRHIAKPLLSMEQRVS